MVPGEIIVDKDNIVFNRDRETFTIRVANTGDRPIQVGSHYHFYEVNEFLAFDRRKAYGCRLHIPAGTAVRFEPGQTRDVHLLHYSGLRQIFGFNKLVHGLLAEVKDVSHN